LEKFSFQAPKEAGGLRLDVVLSMMAPDLSRSAAAKLISAGLATIDGKPSKASIKVRPGSIIELSIPDPEPLDLIPEPMDLSILYEDQYLVVIDKPAGLVVHPGAGHSSGTLVHGLLARWPSVADVGDPFRPGIVHRLDKGTSGVMVAAKDRVAHRRLSEAFAERKIKKTYLALVLDPPKDSTGAIGMPVGRHPSDRKRMSSLTSSGREALTEYSLLASAAGVGLMKLNLRTGRTHQVRVHCSESGFPLAADALYGGVRRIKNVGDLKLREMLAALQRPALHAFCLGFDHPIDKLPMLFSAPLPEDLAAPSLRVIELSQGLKK